MWKEDIGHIHGNDIPHEGEPFMCPSQESFFRSKLILMKNELYAELDKPIVPLYSNGFESDEIDAALKGMYQEMELQKRERASNMIKRIDQALKRIDSGEYGFCETTGDPIGLKRLIANPTATRSIEAQTFYETGEPYRVFRSIEECHEREVYERGIDNSEDPEGETALEYIQV